MGGDFGRPAPCSGSPVRRRPTARSPGRTPEPTSTSRRPSGSWNEWAPGGGRLTGYYQSVYTEGNCYQGTSDASNWWQRWYEIPTSSGWKLQNRETGYILDDAGNGAVCTNAYDAGDTDLNQRWH